MMPAIAYTITPCTQCKEHEQDCDGAPGKGSCTPCRASAKGGAKCSHNPGRPPNAFILFRLSYVKDLPSDTKSKRQALSSKSAATAWKELSRQERLHWHEEAEKKKEEHVRLYPNYTYTPTTKSMKAARHASQGRVQGSRLKKQTLDVNALRLGSRIDRRHVSLSPSPSIASAGLSPISLPVALDLAPVRTPTPSDGSPISIVSSCYSSPASVPSSLETSPEFSSQAYPGEYFDVGLQWNMEPHFEPCWPQIEHVDELYSHHPEYDYQQRVDAHSSYAPLIDPLYPAHAQLDYFESPSDSFGPPVPPPQEWEYLQSSGPLLYTPAESIAYEELINDY